MKEKTSKVWSVDKTSVKIEESARAVVLRDSVNKVFRKTGQNSQKIPVLESLFNWLLAIDKSLYIAIILEL